MTRIELLLLKRINDLQNNLASLKIESIMRPDDIKLKMEFEQTIDEIEMAKDDLQEIV